MLKGLTVSEAAEMLKVSPSTLRRYEALGLVPPPKRHVLGWRVYDLETIRELQQKLEPKVTVGV